MTLDHGSGDKGRSWPERPGGMLGGGRAGESGDHGPAGLRAGLPSGSRHGMRIKPAWWLLGAAISLALWYGIYLAI